MSFYKFGPNDVFNNQIKTHPQQSFFIYRCKIYLNNTPEISGAFVSNVGSVPTGYANLYEMNVDRPSGQLIYPFITKDGSLTTFSTISTSNFNNDFVYGDVVSGSYPLSASITSSHYSAGSPTTAQPKREIQALRTSLDSYSPLSPHYAYSSSLGNKLTQEMRIVSIPSIFYGSSIEKGSIAVKVYVSGTQVGELRDDLKNGELRQVGNIPSSGIIKKNNLFVHYKFDESLSDGDWRGGDGDTLLDSSGNGYHATPSPVGDEILQVEGKFISGALGQGSDLVGTAGSYHFEYSTISQTGSTGNSGGFTVACWLSKSYDSQDGALNGDGYTLVSNLGAGDGWRLYIGSTGYNSATSKAYWQINDTSGNTAYITSSMPGGGLSGWTHFAATYKAGTEPLLYVNGVRQSDSGIAATFGTYPTSQLRSSGILKLMGEAIGSDDYLTGAIDDVRLYNKILSAEEISKIYNATSGPGSEVIVPSGTVAGVAMYNEGFLIITGSWDLDITDLQWNEANCGSNTNARWIDILQSPPECDSDCNSSVLASASFGLDFRGTQYVPVKTMFAHAPRGELNYSNNPTFLKFGSSSYNADPTNAHLAYQENPKVPLKNIVSGTWAEPTASFEKTTYISKICVYDKNKNLIGVAKLANPVRKREIDDYTFKLKLDF